MQFDMFAQLYKSSFYFPFYAMLFLLFSLSLCFLMSIFPSKEIYRLPGFFVLEYLKVCYRLREMQYILDYHPNTEISYLEVVSLLPLKPASLAIVSSSLPCSRRCWSCKLPSRWKADCAILSSENHGLQNLLFATFAALDHWLV